MGLTLTFHGQSTLLLEDSTHTLLVDPFFTSNPLATIAADDVTCTHIAVTHGHFDHFEDCESIATRCNATVYAGFEICEYLNEQGHEACEPGSIGGRIPAPFGSIAFTAAVHSSSFMGRQMGTAMGLIIEMGGVTIYSAGDTGLFGDMALIGELYSPDVAILPIGDRFTMGPEHAMRAAKLVGAPIAIPVHYDTWPPIEQDPTSFAPPGIEVRILAPGESTSFGS